MTHETLIAETEAWLLREAVQGPEIVELFGTLCTRLHSIGVPVVRAALSWPVLHPLFQAEQIYWRLGEGAELYQYRHDAGESPQFQSSPFHYMLRHRTPQLRRRLTGPETTLDFPVLEELHEEGFTDYLMTSAELAIAEVRAYRGGEPGVLASWATKREGGFSSDDIKALVRIQRAFAVACHASIQTRVMGNLAEVYLGATAAHQVLSGAVQRGAGEMIRAVVWLSDLRGSTRLSNAMAPEDYLQLLGDYYDCTAQPVIEQGGEILEFIGDAVLAIFPIEGDTGGPKAIRAATAAMDDALARRDAAMTRRRAQGLEGEIKFSISMTVGEMMFGNIGVPQRLTFSAVGRAVNKVSRIEDLGKSIGRGVLVTSEIADVDPRRWKSAGFHELRDFDQPLELMTCACALDSVAPLAGDGALPAARGPEAEGGDAIPA